MKERDYSLDFLAGLLLFHIIYSHCCSICKVDYDLNMSFVAFYMPWFFFKGGMFFRADKSAKMLTRRVSFVFHGCNRYGISLLGKKKTI